MAICSRFQHCRPAFLTDSMLGLQASVIQAGSGAVFLGVGTAANVSYAGGANTTYIQGTGLGLSGLPADVAYTTTGRPQCFASS